MYTFKTLFNSLRDSWIIPSLILGVCLTGRVSEAEEPPAESVWITSVQWTTPTDLMATQSQGLLLRPGSVVRLSAQDPQKLEKVGEAETSLWSLVVKDDQVLASDYKGGVLNFVAGKPQPLEIKDTRWIRCLKLAPTSNRELLAGTENGSLIVLDSSNFSELRRVSVENAAIFDVCFHPQQQQLAVATGNGKIHLLSWPNLEPQKILNGSGAIWSCQFTSDGSQLVSGGADHKVRLWDLTSGESVLAISSARDWITCIRPLGNCNCMLAGSLDGQVAVVDYATRRQVKTHKVAGSGVWDMAVSADNKQLAVATRKHGILILDISNWPDEAKAAALEADVEKPPVPQQ